MLKAMRAIVLAGIGGALALAAAASAADLTTEPGTDRWGSDYKGFDVAADPALCRQACAGDANCKAYTYVKPGVQGPSARCYLKNPAPASKPNDCCVSGVKSATTMIARPGLVLKSEPVARPPAGGATTATRPGGGTVAVNTGAIVGFNPYLAMTGTDPGDLGHGYGQGSLNGVNPSTLPACPASGAPALVKESLELLTKVAQSFGGSFSLNSQCGTYTREVTAGVDLWAAPIAEGSYRRWNDLGGRGSLMADSLVCLARDLQNRPGARLVNQTAKAGGARLIQTIGISKWDPAKKRAELYHVARICALLIGCFDAQRQKIILEARATEPTWPKPIRVGDYMITGVYSVETSAEWGAAQLTATLPAFPITTPYGDISVQPGFSYSSSLYPQDTPFGGAPDPTHAIFVPNSNVTANAILSDTYGRVNVAGILDIDANTAQAMTTRPANYPSNLIWLGEPIPPLKAQGWASQTAFGARDGTADAVLYKPAAGALNPPRNDYDFKTPRSGLERAPTANYVASASVKYQPPMTEILNKIPSSVRGLIGDIVLIIEIKPEYAADFAAQFDVIAREAAVAQACSYGGEFRGDCGVTEAELVAQAYAEGRARLTGKVYLKIDFNLPFVDTIEKTFPFSKTLYEDGDDAPDLIRKDADARARGAYVIHVAEGAPDTVFVQAMRGYSGATSGDLKAWTDACLIVPEAAPSTPPAPTHEPGDKEDIAPDLLPCNICVAEEEQNAFSPFRIFATANRAPGVATWRCDNLKNAGCYDLCSYDKSTGALTRAEVSALEIIGDTCNAPYIAPPK